ncbi:hypothetical protein [Alishewanella sp. HH-ZS]|uniref:NMCC_0638 family (lipo)protein n=1 Tax=Alishewanella sp. HH-ZS TaxID=1856684 RepID=UPI001146DCF6|nr:hypothetical protein [Alishewanella sp. HH-ZS]
MKLAQVFVIPILVLSSVACSDSRKPTDEFFAANFSVSSCIRYAGNEKGIESLMKQQGVVLLPDDKASQFLGSHTGKAWSFTSPNGQFALTYLNSGLCTVFVRRVNTQKYAEEVTNSFSRISKKTGWSFTPSIVPNFAGKTELETFRLEAKTTTGQTVEVIISATENNTGSYQVALSSQVI